MSQHVFILIMEISLLVSIGIGICIIFLASIYDVMRIAKRRMYQTIAAGLRKPRQPHVHILVYAQNDEQTIVQSLRSIFRSRYRHFAVTVVDNRSTDHTARVVQEYIDKHPNYLLRLHIKRKQSTPAQALRAAYKNNKKDDIIFTIRADSSIPPLFIKEAVARFEAKPYIVALRVNDASSDYRSVGLLIARFTELSRHMVVKAAVMLGRAKIERATLNVLYRRKVFTSQKTSPTIPYTYEGSLVITTRSKIRSRPHYFTTLLSLYVIISMSYFLYIAATLQTSSLLMLSWSALIIWLLAITWSDESSKTKTKIGLSLSTPSYYFLFYIQLIITVSIAIWSLILTLKPSRFWLLVFNHRVSISK